MIGVIASILAGVILKEYLLFASPVVFLLSLKNRDLGLVGYSLYVLYSGSKILAMDVYSYGELVRGLIFTLSSLLLLEDVLRREIRIDKSEIIPTAIIMVGILIPEGFIAGAVLYFLALKSSWKVVVPIFVAMGVFALSQDYISDLGTSGQAIALGSLTLFTIALALILKNPKRVEMMEKV